jgi:hypothetical protein
MRGHSLKYTFGCCGLLLLAFMFTGCSKRAQTVEQEKSRADTGTTVQVHQIPAGKEFAGFLGDYSKLKPNTEIEGNALSYVRADALKNLHKYIAVIVEPVQVYVASDADISKFTPHARGALAGYFRGALTAAVADAFPVVDEKGPLVLRLRSAIVGVDIGGETAEADRAADGSEALARALNIGKVGVEMELLDSETGEQIAAMVDRENLGEGAEVGSAKFSRYDKYMAARQAFDGWAGRVRLFLDSAHELSGEDAARADKSYRDSDPRKLWSWKTSRSRFSPGRERRFPSARTSIPVSSRRTFPSLAPKRCFRWAPGC